MQIEIRGLKEKISEATRTYIERRLSYALGRFGRRVRGVMVRLEDLNGPRGGLDKRCHIEAHVAGRGSLVVDVRDVELEPAIARAADRIRRRVGDELSMRREVRKRAGTPVEGLSAA